MSAHFKRVRSRLLLILPCCLFVVAASGQVAQIWDGHGDATNIDVGSNYIGNVFPNASVNDTAVLDGRLPGNLLLNYKGNWQSGPGQSGIDIHLTSNQVGSVTIDNFTGNANPPNFAFYNIIIDKGAGAFQFGGEVNMLNYVGRPGGAVHHMVNNSTNTATIGSTIYMFAGGGTPFTFDFSGTGNWKANCFLATDQTPNNNTTIQVDGPGTLIWKPFLASGVSVMNGIAALNITGGSVLLLTNHPKLISPPFTINGAFQFAPSQAATQSLSGPISGSGILQVSGGTLSLSGASKFSGTNLLSGGQLIANGPENPGISGPLGHGNIITFAGGVLKFSANNAFDFSPRFDTAPGQQYNIDTAGQNVTFASALNSSGGMLNKLGNGTLSLAGNNTFSGPINVSGGKLAIQGSIASSTITVADGAGLGIFENNSPLTLSTLTLGTSLGTILEFNNVTNASVPALMVSTLSSAGPVQININSSSFSAIGQTFPLLAWINGIAPAVSLGQIAGATGILSTNGNSIVLTITKTADVWTGAQSAIWDLATANWSSSGTPLSFSQGDSVLFDDSAASNQTITISGVVLPANIFFNNVHSNYSLTTSPGNQIGGGTAFTLLGSGNVAISGGANSYTGVTTLANGTLAISKLANGGSPSDIGAAGNSPANLVLNGGTLQYTGPAVSIDRLFTLDIGGGAIDSSGTGPLSLTNVAALGLNNYNFIQFTLSGTSSGNVLASSVPTNSSGTTSLTKSGSGSWILTGTNAISGPVNISQSVLQIGAGGASGTIGTGNIINNGALDFNRSGTLVISGDVSGTGSVTNDGIGTTILMGHNSYNGYTVINAGTLQIGNSTTNGTLPLGWPVVNNGTLTFMSLGAVTLSGFASGITGTGNLRILSGTVKAIGNNTYSGWTEIASGATFQPTEGNQGLLTSTSVITNRGTLYLARQDTDVFAISNNIIGTGRVLVDQVNDNLGEVLLLGTNNTYTGGTIIGAGWVRLGDGLRPGSGTIAGTVMFTNTTDYTITFFSQNRRLIFNHPEDYLFTNNVISRVSDGSSIWNSGTIEQRGPGAVTLTGSNDYPADTIIDSGATLQVGNGGTSGTIGTGGVMNEGTLILNRAGTLTINGPITGTAGAVNQIGSGTTILAGSNTVAGDMSISNGTLVVRATVGNINVDGGTLAIGSISIPTNLFAANSININSGSVLVTVNKSLAQSNSFITAAQVNYTGGTLVVTNPGPNLTVGDKFVVFSKPVPNAHAMPVVSTYTAFQNNLEVDGSITVTFVGQPPQPKLNRPFVLNGSNIVFSATNNFGAGGTFTLYGTTNSIALPLTNWPFISNGQFDASGQLFITNTVKNGPFFYYLRQP